MVALINNGPQIMSQNLQNKKWRILDHHEKRSIDLLKDSNDLSLVPSFYMQHILHLTASRTPLFLTEMFPNQNKCFALRHSILKNLNKTRYQDYKGRLVLQKTTTICFLLYQPIGGRETVLLKITYWKNKRHISTQYAVPQQEPVPPIRIRNYFPPLQQKMQTQQKEHLKSRPSQHDTFYKGHLSPST